MCSELAGILGLVFLWWIQDHLAASSTAAIALLFILPLPAPLLLTFWLVWFRLEPEPPSGER